jgi:hypothetical protein
MRIALVCGILLWSIVAAVSVADDEGFVSLAASPALEGWRTMGGGHWQLEEGGVVSCDGQGGGWLRSVAVYEDFTLRFGFRIVENGNSGVWLRAPLRGRQSAVGFEMQILGTRIDPPTRDSTGALYDLLAPSTDAARPAGEWNDAEVSCHGGHVATVLNGTEVVNADLDDPAWNASEPAGKRPGERNRRGFIGLTNHGARVWYRDLRISVEPEAGFAPLFDGSTLAGWKPRAGTPWSAEGGLLVHEGDGSSSIATERPIGDCVLRLEYRLGAGARASVIARAAERNANPRVEIALADDAGKPATAEGSGALRGIGTPRFNAALPTGEWNDLELTLTGVSVDANLNATPVLDGSLHWFGSFFGLPAKSPIVLQAEAGRVEFRNIRVRELAPSATGG